MASRGRAEGGTTRTPRGDQVAVAVERTALPHPGGRCSLSGITKIIGTHRILTEVSLELRGREVHVLVGANGAGKSTLIRILSGADTDFRGTVWFNGQKLHLRNPREGRRAGIHVIYQELSLVGSLSATDNWLLSESRGGLSWLSRTRTRARVLEQCQRFELALDVDCPVERLTLGERQLLEIARATSEPSQVLVLDEPTSALSETEATRLLGHLDRLRQQGTAILYVSHRMEEIYEIADRISVLRDGVLVLTRLARDLPREELIAAMVGHAAPSEPQLPVAATESSASPATSRLSVRSLSTSDRPRLHEISFEVPPREIFGVCGLEGSGASELLQVIGGARRRAAGTIEWHGAEVSFATPRQAFLSRFAYLPRDRGESVLPAMTLLDNGSLSALDRLSTRGVVRRKRCRDAVAGLARAMALDAYSLDSQAGHLSGGNQQKLALLRCLLSEPQVLLLDEPTRGVDVAAKEAIHLWIRRVAAEGLTVILHSSELDELLALCGRVLALHLGRAVALLPRADLDRTRLLSAMMGQEP